MAGLAALSRVFAPADYVNLGEELAVVDRQIGALNHHRWECALALQAIGQWSERYPLQAGDLAYRVGTTPGWLGELGASVCCDVVTLDPVESYAVPGRRLAAFILALSVIEHVPDVESFLYHLSCLLAPGGLLVLTMPFWNSCGPDTAWNHQARQRIFCPKTHQALRLQARLLHLQPFGGVDLTWHGPQVQDYSLASLVLEKRR